MTKTLLSSRSTSLWGPMVNSFNIVTIIQSISNHKNHNMKKMKLMIMLSMALSISCLYAQEITNTGAGNLKLGMTIKQFKAAYPAAKIKKVDAD